MARMSSSETNAARTRTGSGSASSRTIADARAGRRVGGDLVAQRAAVACAVAEHQVGLGGLVQPQRDLVGEQVADVQDFLARVLQRGDDAVADRAALSGQGGQRGQDALAELAVGLVGGQERDLIDQDHDERVRGGRGVVALAAGEPGGPFLHRGHVGFEQGRRCRPGRRRSRRSARTAPGRRPAPSAWGHRPGPGPARRPSPGAWPGSGPTGRSPCPLRWPRRSAGACRAAGSRGPGRPRGSRPAAPAGPGSRAGIGSAGMTAARASRRTSSRTTQPGLPVRTRHDSTPNPCASSSARSANGSAPARTPAARSPGRRMPRPGPGRAPGPGGGPARSARARRWSAPIASAAGRTTTATGCDRPGHQPGEPGRPAQPQQRPEPRLTRPRTTPGPASR